MATSISVLAWQRTDELTRFVADINPDEFFVIRFDEEQNPGYRWRLSICRRSMAMGVFLHGHITLEEAKHAALVHLGEA